MSEPIDHDAIKAELIRMRKYVIFHGIRLGECVAWNKLKKMFGVGNRDQEDVDWLAAYTKAEPQAMKVGMSAQLRDAAFHGLLASCQKALAAFDAANLEGAGRWSGEDVEMMREAVAQATGVFSEGQ
jgi:hypothetical protein